MAKRSLSDVGVSQKRKADETSSLSTPQKKSKSDANPGTPGSASKLRTFNSDWLEQFDWLEYDASNKRMFCKVCRAANVHSVFTKGGAG